MRRTKDDMGTKFSVPKIVVERISDLSEGYFVAIRVEPVKAYQPNLLIAGIEADCLGEIAKADCLGKLLGGIPSYHLHQGFALLTTRRHP